MLLIRCNSARHPKARTMRPSAIKRWPLVCLPDVGYASQQEEIQGGLACGQQLLYAGVLTDLASDRCVGQTSVCSVTLSRFVSMSVFVSPRFVPFLCRASRRCRFFSCALCPCAGDQEQGLAELDDIMSVAQRSRSVASTAMNAQSSRSHSVFTLWLTGVDASTGTTLKVR